MLKTVVEEDGETKFTVDNDDSRKDAINELKKLDYRIKLVAVGSFLTLILLFMLLLMHIFAPSSALSGHNIMDLTASGGIGGKILAFMNSHSVSLILVGMGFLLTHRLKNKRDEILKKEGIEDTDETRISFKEFFKYMQQDIERQRESFHRIFNSTFSRGGNNQLELEKLDN